MSSEEAFRADLIRELERLAARFIANCRANNKTPDITWHGVVEATEAYKVLGLFDRTRTSIDELDLDGWPMPDVTHIHHPTDKSWWLLEDGSVCHVKRVFQLNPIGSRLTEHDIITRKLPGELHVNDIQATIAQLADLLDGTH